MADTPVKGEVCGRRRLGVELEFFASKKVDKFETQYPYKCSCGSRAQQQETSLHAGRKITETIVGDMRESNYCVEENKMRFSLPGGSSAEYSRSSATPTSSYGVIAV